MKTCGRQLLRRSTPAVIRGCRGVTLSWPGNDRRACVVRVAKRRGATGSEGFSVARRFLRAARARTTSCPGQPASPRSSLSGFTLIEMIMVLVIIAILAATAMPAFNSAVNEHRVREDGHELAMMVRKAMIQSGEQHRAFYIDLTKHSARLYAEGDQTQQEADSDASLFKDSGSTNADAPIQEAMTQTGVDQTQTLDGDNKLQVLDPTKQNVFMDVPDDGKEWIFQPGELCPADKLRVVRGDAYLEMDFTALTGAVDSEKYYFP